MDLDEQLVYSLIHASQRWREAKVNGQVPFQGWRVYLHGKDPTSVGTYGRILRAGGAIVLDDISNVSIKSLFFFLKQNIINWIESITLMNELKLTFPPI